MSLTVKNLDSPRIAGKNNDIRVFDLEGELAANSAPANHLLPVKILKDILLTIPEESMPLKVIVNVSGVTREVDGALNSQAYGLLRIAESLNNHRGIATQ